MYIQKAQIKNIRSIENFEIEFKNPAGWHVLIGDNGAGKSTIVRSMALGLIGKQRQGLHENWQEWIYRQSANAQISLSLFKDERFDKLQETDYPIDFPHVVVSQLNFHRNFLDSSLKQRLFTDRVEVSIEYAESGFFSAAYGPYRRFEGGSSEWLKVFETPGLERLAAHLSVFDESVALTEPIKWILALFNMSNDPTRSKSEKKASLDIIENIKKLINSRDKEGSFLSHNTELDQINSENIFFKDGNGAIISVNQMSDGYRSVLSLTFELIRQLVRVYGSELVFKNIEKGEMSIDLPGVVLVDEIDAHLHPTWQTRIGQWFLKYFPKLQFIVTTHSPLVCRAAENGSIWRLKAPGSDETSGEITGLDRERLIYGNILDAYGTEVFGENVSISEKSDEILNRLSELNVKSMIGSINEKESSELQELRAKSPTEDTQKRTSEWLIEKFEKLENYLDEKETIFTQREKESRTEYQKSRVVLSQEWKNLKAILGMSKVDLDKEKDSLSELKTGKKHNTKEEEK